MKEKIIYRYFKFFVRIENRQLSHQHIWHVWNFCREGRNHRFKRISRSKGESKADRSRYVFVRIIEAGILSCPRTHNIYFQNGPTTKFRSAVPYYSSHSPTRVHLLAGKSDKRTNKRFVITSILIETSLFSHLILLLLTEGW